MLFIVVSYFLKTTFLMVDIAYSLDEIEEACQYFHRKGVSMAKKCLKVWNYYYIFLFLPQTFQARMASW